MSTFPEVRKAVIPIAGWGTRMYPATKSVPKALFPMTDLDGLCKPIIHIIIEEALSALGEAGQICIVVQEGQQESIQDYFNTPALSVYTKKPELQRVIQRMADIGKRLHFVKQDKQEGFGHAVLCAKDFVGDEPFLVLLGDHVYISTHQGKETPSKQLIKAYQKYGKSVTSLDICSETNLHLNGVVTGNMISEAKTDEGALYEITKTIEKPDAEVAQKELKTPGIPEGSYLCYFGVDLLTPRLLSILQENYDNQVRTKGELQLRDAMGELAKQEGLQGLKVLATRHDTGNPWEFAQAVEAYRVEAESRKSKSS